MLFDLFSSLDFSMYKNKMLKKLIWMVSMMWMMFFFNFFFFNNNFFSFMKMLKNNFFMNTKINMLKLMKLSYFFFLNIFFFILLSKMWGLMPYIYGKTTQIVLSLGFSLTFWLTIFLSKIVFKFKSFSAHLTPDNSPFFLIKILKKMELFSIMIRPLTLSLRLSIKMSTGHIFFILLCKGFLKIFFKNNLLFLFFFLMMFFYLFFELGMCVLQSFVFSLLCIKYLDEHKNK